jgi:hypothetical protein
VQVGEGLSVGVLDAVRVGVMVRVGVFVPMLMFKHSSFDGLLSLPLWSTAVTTKQLLP